MAIARHFDRDYRALFALMVLSKWLLVGTFNAVVSYAERETRPEGQTKRRYRTCAPFIPLHLLYFVIFILNFVPEIGFHCRDEIHFPLIAMLQEVGFVVTVAGIFILRAKNWLIDWDFEGQSERNRAIMEIFR